MSFPLCKPELSHFVSIESPAELMRPLPGESARDLVWLALQWPTQLKENRKNISHSLCGEWRYNPTAQASPPPLLEPKQTPIDEGNWLVTHTHTHTHMLRIMQCPHVHADDESPTAMTVRILLLGMSVEKNEADKVCVSTRDRICLLSVWVCLLGSHGNEEPLTKSIWAMSV